MDLKEYVGRYSRDNQVFWAAAIPWRRYKGILKPLSPPHIEPDSNSGEIKKLLQASKTPLAMWTYNFDSARSEWWWTIAERPYHLESLAKKARYDIRYGLRSCNVRRVSGRLLADIGYACYASAMQRHVQTAPDTEPVFKAAMPVYDANEAYQIWGVFMNDRLIGYGVYLLIDDIVINQDAIFDPAYFRYHVSHALVHTTTDYYLNQMDCRYITTGTRAISHDTRFEDFLMRNFGYRRAYCGLGLEFRPAFRILVDCLYGLRGWWKKLPISGDVKHRLHVICELERIRGESRV